MSSIKLITSISPVNTPMKFIGKSFSPQVRAGFSPSPEVGEAGRNPRAVLLCSVPPDCCLSYSEPPSRTRHELGVTSTSKRPTAPIYAAGVPLVRGGFLNLFWGLRTTTLTLDPDRSQAWRIIARASVSPGHGHASRSCWTWPYSLPTSRTECSSSRPSMGGEPPTERALRTVIRRANWKEQRAAFTPRVAPRVAPWCPPPRAGLDSGSPLTRYRTVVSLQRGPGAARARDGRHFMVCWTTRNVLDPRRAGSQHRTGDPDETTPRLGQLHLREPGGPGLRRLGARAAWRSARADGSARVW